MINIFMEKILIPLEDHLFSLIKFGPNMLIIGLTQVFSGKHEKKTYFIFKTNRDSLEEDYVDLSGIKVCHRSTWE